MKTKKLLSFFLLLSMSFSVLHSFAIEALDTHQCHVGEYVQEFDKPINDELSGDICNIHHEFHTPFIIPEQALFTSNASISEQPLSTQDTHDYTQSQNLLRPPKA